MCLFEILFFVVVAVVVEPAHRPIRRPNFELGANFDGMGSWAKLVD